VNTNNIEKIKLAHEAMSLNGKVAITAEGINAEETIETTL